MSVLKKISKKPKKINEHFKINTLCILFLTTICCFKYN